jgi:predicted ribosomally synthesized peptide with SipW-like signal peptide
MERTDIELDRRHVLASLGGIGAAGALGGAGTMAWLNDTESFTGNGVTAGELDLRLDWWLFYQGAERSVDEHDLTDNPGPIFDFGDVKPGDYGGGCISVHVSGNPAWVWMGGRLRSNLENGRPEPEREVDETGGDPGEGNGELADRLRAVAFPLGYCDVCTGSVETEARRKVREPHPASRDSYEFGVLAEGSLREVLAALRDGALLDGWPQNAEAGHCVQPGHTYYVGIQWWLPEAVGNEVQGDSVVFDVPFYAEQCRHNDEPEPPWRADT